MRCGVPQVGVLPIDWSRFLQQINSPFFDDFISSNVETRNAQTRNVETRYIAGMDSLTSVELKNRLQKSLGISLSSTIIFDRPNLNALIDYLVEEMGLENDEVEQQPVEEETESEELSEDDIADLLAQELMEIERGKES